eukprot:6202155-Pleurochrysis_carterae.AAC.3
MLGEHIFNLKAHQEVVYSPKNSSENRDELQFRVIRVTSVTRLFTGLVLVECTPAARSGTKSLLGKSG